MLNLWNHGRQNVVETPALRVALVGESYRRNFIRELLENHVTVVGELASDRRVGHLTAVEPQIVILDCVSQDVNPLVTLPLLATLAGSPCIVALTDNTLASTLTERALLDLGADAVIDTRDVSTLSRIIRFVDTQIEEDRSPVAA